MLGQALSPCLTLNKNKRFHKVHEYRSAQYVKSAFLFPCVLLYFEVEPSSCQSGSQMRTALSLQLEGYFNRRVTPINGSKKVIWSPVPTPGGLVESQRSVELSSRGRQGADSAFSFIKSRLLFCSLPQFCTET